MSTLLSRIFLKIKFWVPTVLIASFLLLSGFSRSSQGTSENPTISPEKQEEVHKEEKFNVLNLIFHHIGDDYYWHVWGDISLPLPIILYVPNEGLHFFSSGKFSHGKKEYKGFEYHHGKLENKNGLHKASFLDIGGKNVYYDFSITKLVSSLLFSFFFTLFIFLTVSKGYKKRTLKAPKGIQSFFEPLILFVRDEIVTQFIPAKRLQGFLPYFLTLFFFIWFTNLMGLVPIIGGSNLSGNIAFTVVLAIITFTLTTINGKRTYWSHILAPDVPKALYFIIVPIEFLGIFTKPFALLIRLFANITAGHVIILSIVSLIFIMSEISLGAGLGASVLTLILGLFLSALELIVAFIQAFIFTLLSALYVGQALEEGDH